MYQSCLLQVVRLMQSERVVMFCLHAQELLGIVTLQVTVSNLDGRVLEPDGRVLMNDETVVQVQE